MTGTLLTTVLALGVALPAPASRPAEADAGVVRATGIGRAPKRYTGVRARLMAERAAQVVATRNLLAKLGHKPTESAPSWTGWIRGYRYLPTRFLDDHTAEVTVEWPVESAPSSVILPRGGDARWFSWLRPRPITLLGTPSTQPATGLPAFGMP